MSTSRRRWLGHALALAAAPAVLGELALAQTSALPQRLRILCGAPPGGTPDLIARRCAERLEPFFAGGVIVENRPGAAGQVAIAALKLAAADGATWLLGHGGLLTLNPLLNERLAYDPQRDLLPLGAVAETAFALAVGPAVPASVTNLATLAEHWRVQPAQANFATPGVGTLTHLLGLRWSSAAGVAARHVTYSGGPAAIADLLGGHVAAVVLPEGLLRPLDGSRGVRLLATSGARRSAWLPQVPTFVEQDHADTIGLEWFAFFAPGGAPPALAESASRVLAEALATPAFAQALAPHALNPTWASPAALQRRVSEERERWRSVIKAHGVRLE